MTFDQNSEMIKHHSDFYFSSCTLVLRFLLYLLGFILFDMLLQAQEQAALPGHSTGRDDTPSNDIILDKQVLNMEPVLKPQPKLLSLDDKILLNVARANVLSQITVGILK